MAEVKMTVDVTGGPQVRALVDLVVRIRNHWLPRLEHEEDFAACAEEIDQVIRGISGQPAHMPEAVQPKREPIVWADDATPFTGPQVRNLLLENEALRKKLGQAEHELGTVAAVAIRDAWRSR